ncbi:MAG: hypothetical protein ROY82_05500 [Truepera sp.]|jgi:hypothetical protein|nr:hypothetical protein [Truepera sp.]
MRNKTRAAALLALVAFTLAACAPTTDDTKRVGVAQLTEPITYYPNQTGATWQYLPNGARLTDPTTTVQILGPTVLEGEVWVAWNARGRGLDEMSYRQVRPDGVWLKRQERLGTTYEFDPPLHEYPAPNSLRVGELWTGTTNVHISAQEGKQTLDVKVDYSYIVVDKRKVTVPAGEIEVFVIDFTSRTTDENGGIKEELKQTTWFTPYFGDVRLRSGQVLVSTNVGPVGTQSP